MRNTVMMTLAWWRPFCATLSSKRRRCRRNAKRCHPCPSLCLCSRTSPSPFLCHLCWHADFLWQGTCWLYCSPSLRSGLPRFLATTMATLSMSHCCKKTEAFSANALPSSSETGDEGVSVGSIAASPPLFTLLSMARSTSSPNTLSG